MGCAKRISFGISRHPDEAVAGVDVGAGIRALAEAVLHLGPSRAEFLVERDPGRSRSCPACSRSCGAGHGNAGGSLGSRVPCGRIGS